MKVMVLVKATKDSEAGVMPSEQLLRDMGKLVREATRVSRARVIGLGGRLFLICGGVPCEKI
jgi:hypothetical protein